MKRVGVATLALVLAVASAGLARQRPLSLDVHDADVYDVIRLIAAAGDVNVVPEGALKHERVTLRLNGVGFDEALQALARACDLQIHRDGTVLSIGPSAEMNRRYGASADGWAQSVAFALRRAKADEVAKELAGALPAGTVVVPDRRTGTLLITGDAPTLARARTLVAVLDAPAYGPGAPAAQQSVAIALRYLRPSEAVKTLKGVVPDASLIADDRGNAVVVTGNDEVVQTAQGLLRALDVPGRQVMFEVKVADVTPVDETSRVGLLFGGASLQGTPTEGSTASAFVNGTIAVNATLNLLVQRGSAALLATPRLLTVNNKEASLLIGESFPIVYFDARTGTQQVQFTDVGVKLRLTATIGEDGAITAELHPEYSAVVSFSNGFPVIGNRRIDATLRVRDGETIVLAGLLSDVRNETLTKIPGLGDLPFVGGLFRNRQKTHTRDEIVFLITPHLVGAAGEPR